MPKLNIKNVEMLAKKTEKAGFEPFESEIHHTPYESEEAFFNCIESGDTKSLNEIMGNYINENIVVGRMSNNDLRQMQYFAVCCIALATRRAIRGGVSEAAAYNLSDRYIQEVDRFKSADDIPPFLFDKAFELTSLVRDSRIQKSYSPTVRRAAYYIEAHLYSKITPKEVSDFCGISKDYLNVLFKRDTGLTTAVYINRAKLIESRRLIERGLSGSEAAYQLSFCSESYFVSCYKKEFGFTPGKTKQN